MSAECWKVRHEAVERVTGVSGLSCLWQNRWWQDSGIALLAGFIISFWEQKYFHCWRVFKIWLLVFWIMMLSWLDSDFNYPANHLITNLHQYILMCTWLLLCLHGSIGQAWEIYEVYIWEGKGSLELCSVSFWSMSFTNYCLWNVLTGCWPSSRDY